MFRTIKRARISGDTFVVGDNSRQQFPRHEVEKMLEKRDKDASERGFVEGHSRGLAEGRAECFSEAKAQYEQRLALVENMLKHLENVQDEILARAQEDIIRLAMVVAAKVIHREVKDPEVVASITGEAIKMSAEKRRITARLNPSDVASLQSSTSSFKETIRNLEKLEFIEDPSIIPGGCIIESSDGNIDARLDRQMEEIRKALLGE